MPRNWFRKKSGAAAVELFLIWLGLAIIVGVDVEGAARKPSPSASGYNWKNPFSY
jgi:hypothetical protein